MRIMWVGSMLATLSSVVAQLVVSYASINDKVTAAILVLLTIGFAGYQANIYQFGIDQLPDASTNAIKSFISWFIWTYSVGGIAGHFIYECIDKQYYVVGQCFFSICLTIALVKSFLLSGIFIKEPVVRSPYKLVYKVIKYMLCKINTLNTEVPSPTVKMSFLHVWIALLHSTACLCIHRCNALQCHQLNKSK